MAKHDNFSDWFKAVAKAIQPPENPKITKLRRLIDHPATGEHERAAAYAAITRLTPEPKYPKPERKPAPQPSPPPPPRNDSKVYRGNSSSAHVVIRNGVARLIIVDDPS